jgi:predicted site-specific integrase-resolvase
MANSNVSLGNRLVSRREAASQLGLKCQTLARWAMTGRHLPVIKIGRNARYRLSDVQRIIEGDGARADLVR